VDTAFLRMLYVLYSIEHRRGLPGARPPTTAASRRGRS
jgi:hypothetical protein